MLPTEIASFINIAANNQLSPEQVTLIMDNVQKTAFQKNTAAFLQYRNILKVYTPITLVASPYTSPSSDDIGRTVSDASTGAGILRAYDSSIFTWYIEVTAPFTNGLVIGVDGGTGGGTISKVETELGYIGPYSAPTDKPCRKVWGITQRKPERFWLDWISFCGLYWVNGLPNNGDYLSFWGAVSPFETGLNDDLTNEFTFSFRPSLKAVYYWVYWQNPPSITGLDDASQIIIPEAYHLQFIQTCNMARGMILEGGDFSDDVVEKYLGGWLDTLRAPFRDQKLNQNMSQGPQTGFGPYGKVGIQGGVYGGGWI